MHNVELQYRYAKLISEEVILKTSLLFDDLFTTTTWYVAICGEQRLRTYSEHSNKVCSSQNEAPNFLTTERLLVSPDLCLLLFALQTQLDVIK